MKRDEGTACLLFAATVSLWQACVAAECEYPPRPPIPISGALCGIVSDLSGTTPLPGLELELDSMTGVVATTRADQKAQFTFGRVPSGEYRLGALGFSTTGHTVFVGDAQATVCKRRLMVHLGVGGECGTRLSTGGGLRLRVATATLAPVLVLVDRNEQSGDFSGRFDFIELLPGIHHVEIQAAAHEPLAFDVTTREFEITTRTANLRRSKR